MSDNPFQGDLDQYFSDWKSLRRTELERGIYNKKTNELEEAGFPVVKTEMSDFEKRWRKYSEEWDKVKDTALS